MKLAICVNHFPPYVGGSEAVCKRLSDFMSDRAEVRVFTRRHPSRGTFPYEVVGYLPSQPDTFGTPLRQFKPDVVLVYGDFFDFLPMLLSRGSHNLILATVGVTRMSRQPVLLNAVKSSESVRALICHSSLIEDARLCQEIGVGNKTVVIHNGVDLNEMSVSATKAELFPDLIDRKWILSVSNFFPGKNQEELLDIAMMLPNPREWAVIQVCNYIEFPIGTTLESKWRAKCVRAQKAGLSTRLAKNYKRESVVALFAASDVLAMTSQKEVTPLVILEAMAAGLPWVATDIGETSGLCGGFVVPAPKDAQGNSVFTAEVRKLFATSITQSTIPGSGTGGGKEQVSEIYDWKNILPQYAALIDRVYAET